MMAAGFIRWKQGYRAARFFLLAWIGFTVCRLIIVLAQVLLLKAANMAGPGPGLRLGCRGVYLGGGSGRPGQSSQAGETTTLSVLQNSEQKLRGIFDHAFQFIGLLKPDGTVVDANQAALDFAGVSESAVLGEFFWETPWWSHSPAEQNTAARCGRAGSTRAVCPLRNHSPRTRRHHSGPSISLSSRCGTRKRQVVMLIPEGRDITGIKQTEAALRETQERYARLAEAAFDGIGVFEDGVLVEANDASRR